MSEPFEGESVREFLRRRGSPDTVVERGLPGLLEQWERAIEDVARGYPYGLDDYLNDLDGRQLLEEALGAASDGERARIRERLDAADARARSLMVNRERCLWGDEVARYHDWDRERNWWYYAVPREPGKDLAEELEGRDG
jgi:hypothetical protein